MRVLPHPDVQETVVAPETNMTWVSVVIASIVCGALLWLIGRTLVLGLRSGRMPHSDSTSTADRRTSPALFWFLTLVFIAFFVLIGAVWIQTIVHALAAM
jgi:hypothetical protein